MTLGETDPSGYASNWVRALDVVTADGELRHATAEDEPELFWAMRGGKSNVGIVTSMTIELLPVSEFYGGPSTTSARPRHRSCARPRNRERM